MAEQWVYVGLFVVAFACLPLILKKLLQTKAAAQLGLPTATKIVSMVNLGPNQRVVTIEVGPENGRVMLVLAVSPQSISCLHQFEVSPVVVAPSSEVKATNVDFRKVA